MAYIFSWLFYSIYKHFNKICLGVLSVAINLLSLVILLKLNSFHGDLVDQAVGLCSPGEPGSGWLIWHGR